MYRGYWLCIEDTVGHHVSGSEEELERDGWLLPGDAQELREEAAQFDGL